MSKSGFAGTLDSIFREFKGLKPTVAVVTCEDDTPDSLGRSTADVVQDYRESMGISQHVLQVIEYPGTGLMAAQLNYALNTIVEPWDYCMVYNADSRPGFGTAADLRRIMRANIPVAQQYSEMTANLVDIEKNLCSSSFGQNQTAILPASLARRFDFELLRGFSLYQTNYELKTGYLGSYLGGLLTAPHVVGHGLVFCRDAFGGMPFSEEAWCEDIQLSFSLANRGVPIFPLKVIETCDMPVRLHDQFEQHARWFKTAFDVIGAARIEAREHPLTVSGYWFLLQRLARSLAWLVSPIAIVTSVAMPMRRRRSAVAVASVAAYLFMCAAEYGLTIALASGIGASDEDVWQFELALPWMPIVRLISCVGPWQSFVLREKRRTPSA